MPPVPPTKFTRTYRKRSASPSAKSSSSSKKMLAASFNPPVPSSSTPKVGRHSDDGYYYEEEYREEHIWNMLQAEALTLAQPELMDQQPELQWRMRPFLIDFIIEVHTQFRLRPEVLYLAVNIVDRYVSRRVVYKKHYQLVGCAALWIAAKFEDSKEVVPLVREFYEMCCSAYEQSAFIQMEGHILTTIAWNINHPTSEGWLRSFLTFADSSQNEHPLVQSTSRFLMEITLFHREFVGVRPSVLAWGSLLLARNICGQRRPPCPDFMTRANESAALRVAAALDIVLHEHRDEISDIVTRKYSIEHFQRCSSYVHEFYESSRRYSFVSDTGSEASMSDSVPALSPSTPIGRGGRRPFDSPCEPFSCASSDAGDEVPITPATPHATAINAPADCVPARHNRENLAPKSQVPSRHLTKANQADVNASMAPPTFYPQQPPADYGFPAAAGAPAARRALRRLSN